MDDLKLSFFSDLMGEERISALDLGARVTEDAPSYLKLGSLLGRATGFDFDPKVSGAFSAQFGPETEVDFIACCLGDGNAKHFVTSAIESTSSIFRSDAAKCGKFDGLAEAYTARHETEIQSRRLDELLINRRFDVIESDLQGADLQVLGAGRSTLSDAVLLIVEGDFLPQFIGAPLFWELAARLNEWGMSFHSFLDFGTRPLQGYDSSWSAPKRGYRQWLWGNAAFLPALERWKTMPGSNLRRLAVVCDLMLGAYDFTWSALVEIDARDNSDWARRYERMLVKNSK